MMDPEPDDDDPLAPTAAALRSPRDAKDSSDGAAAGAEPHGARGGKGASFFLDPRFVYTRAALSITTPTGSRLPSIFPI